MKITLNLAGTNISIIFLGQAKKAIPLCNHFFGDFLHPDQRIDAKMKVNILKKPDDNFPIRSTARNPISEQLLSTQDVAAWLRQVPEYHDDFPISEKTICSFCMDGLLLFNPVTAAGRIYLLKQAPGFFQPLYRLFWMYFAQVLGEEEGCFIHSAALAKDEEGYLFVGDSGAGKSTLARVCSECSVLSDDGPILRKRDGEYRVFASPYHQMDLLKSLDKDVIKMSAKLKGFYFLTKDNRVYLEELSKKKAISMIIKRHIHFFSYLSTKAKSAIFDLFFEACHKLDTYYLHFCRDQDVLRFITGK